MSLSLVFFIIVAVFGLARRLVADYAHHVLLERFFLQEKAVFVPDEIGRLRVEVVALHAAFEKTEDVFEVRIAREREPAAVVHVLFEFKRLVQAELVDGYLLLLALDIIILFVLGASR